MESMLNRGESIHTSTSMRLAKRPPSGQSMDSRKTRSQVDANVAFGGLAGDSSGWGNSQKAKAPAEKKKPSHSGHSSQKSRNNSGNESSEDELLLSGASIGGSSPVKPKDKKPARGNDDGIYHGGKFIPYTEEQKARKNALSNLKFKKTTATGTASSSSSSQPRPPPPSSQPSSSQSRSGVSKKATSPIRCPSPPTPVVKERPRPRPVAKPRINPYGNRVPVSSSKVSEDIISVDEDEDEDESEDVTAPAPKRRPAEFPMPSPPRPTSQPEPKRKPLAPKEFPLSPLGNSKLRDNVSREPAPYSMPSPLFKDKIPSEFPMPSPLSKDKPSGGPTSRLGKMDKGKGKAKAKPDYDDDDEDEDDDLPSIIKAMKKTKGKEKQTVRQPAPFPMSTQVLSRIGDVPRSKSGKRFSPAFSDEEDRDTKKTKRSAVPVLADDTFYDEGDSILIAPTVDPKTLCPYCDTPLPPSPSPLLLRLLAATKEKSTRDHRPANPLGRKAPLGVFVVVCQRHQFESQILPEAELKRWPKSIKWDALGSRIRQMKPQLHALINDADPSAGTDDWDVVYTNSLKKAKKSPRDRCIFWQEIVEEVKKKGSRSVTGVQGQFANFEKAQPGYYGELGSSIIQQTLYDLFPPSSMDPAVFAPLTANEFVQRVMIPEVAIRLVMEDQSLAGEAGMREALTILRESSSYGAAMFPDDSAEAGRKKTGVGLAASEQIVFDRAMKRRKELEEEELREEQERQEEEEAMVVSEMEEPVKPTRKRPVRQAQPQESDAQDSDFAAVPTKSRPRPKPVAKGSSGVIEPRVTRSATSTDVDLFGAETAAEMSSNDSDDGLFPQPSNAQRATSVERRRSPSISETRVVAPPKPGPTRSTKGSFVSLSLSDSSESERSTKSTTTRKTRASTRAGSAKPPPSRQVQQNSSDMDIDDDDSELEIVAIDLKTPKPKSKFKAKLSSPAVENDDTPKPATRTSVVNEADLPPLARARLKHRLAPSSSSGATNVSEYKPPSGMKADFDIKYTKGVRPLAKKGSYAWLLSD